MRVAIIAAVADNGVIGRAGDLPWKLPADLQRFRRLTMGHHLIVGRKTWQSIGRPLAGRTILVLTRAAALAPAGAQRCADLAEALERAAAAGDDEPFVAGGAEVYRLALPLADRLYLTRVHASPAGDVLFPELDPDHWRLVERQQRPADERNPHPLSFEVYDRERDGRRASAVRSSSRLR